MKPDGNGYRLSTGRVFYCNNGILGISDEYADNPDLNHFPEGYDGGIDIDDWTIEEKLELVDYAINLWVTVRERLVRHDERI